MNRININRLFLGFITLFAITFAFYGTSNAAEIRSFEQQAFEKAQEAGKTILVDVHADWCSTCRKQQEVLHGLSQEEAFQNAVFFTVDFDKDQEAVRDFRVRYQSTLIVFQGKKELARSIGQTNPQKIRSLFEEKI